MSFAELEVLVNGLRRSEETVFNGEVLKEYFVGEQSYECLKELQRFLRREKLSDTKDVLKQLASWNIVKNQLLPLMISLQFENQEEDVDIYGMSYEICKLLVMLTLPPEPKSYDIPLQISYLQDYKEAFLAYPNNEAISSFVHLLLTEPLSREGRARTEEDERLIELILSLFKNLLLIPDRVIQSGASASFHKSQLQDDLFTAFKKADVFDLLMMMTNNLNVKESTRVFDFESDDEEKEEEEEKDEEEKEDEEKEEEKEEEEEKNEEDEKQDEEEKDEAANEEKAASKPVASQVNDEEPKEAEDEPMQTESKEDEEKEPSNKDGEGEVVEEVVEESHVLHRQMDREMNTVEKIKKRETGFKKWAMLLLELYTLILKREKPEQLVQTFFKYHSLATKKLATPERTTEQTKNISPEKSKPALGRTPLSALLTAEHTSLWKTNRSPVQTVVAKRGTYIIQEGSHLMVKKSLIETTTARSVNAALNAPPIKRNPRQKTMDNMNANVAPSFGVTGDQAQLVLREFVQNFLDRGCYNSLMDCAKQQLKDPSTQTSHILSDQVNFILLIKFFTGYVYCDFVMRKQLRGQDHLSIDEIDITQLRSTIHSSDFREILSFCSLYYDEKNWNSLTVAVSALKNMFNVMKALSGCPSDSAQLIAKKLHHQVFYYDTTLESIINILKSFDSSKHTLSYLREIVELMHVVNSLVAHNGPVIVQHKKKRINTNRRKKKKASGSLIDDEAQKEEGQGSKEGEPEKKNDDAMAVEKEQTSEAALEGVTANSQENSEDVRAVKDFIETLDSEQKKKEKEAMKEIEKEAEKKEVEIEEEAEDDEEDEEDKEVYLEKVVNMEEYYSKFAHPVIIQNYSLLLKHYKQNPPALNHFLVSFLNRICTHTPFEPMLYQLSIINIFNEILNDKTITSSQTHEELVSFAARVARNFLQVLREEENLSVLVFAWKRKQDCYYLHPKGSTFHEKFQKSEASKKEKANKQKKAKKEKKKVVIRVDVEWTEEEDKMLRELYERHKNSDICFDLMYPHFADPNKRSIQVIFDRLLQLHVISEDHPRPKELEEESEEEEEAESSEEEEELVIRLDDEEENPVTDALPDNVDQELVDLVYKVLLKNYIAAMDLLKKEIDTTIDHREGVNPEELDDVNDHLIIPMLEAETEQLNHDSVINLLTHLGLTNMNNNIKSWWRIPKTMLSEQLKTLKEKIEAAEKYAKQKIQKQNELRKKFLDTKGKPVKKAPRKKRQTVTEVKEPQVQLKEKEVPKKAPKPVERIEPKKQKKNKDEERKVLDEKRKEALETMKQRLSDIKKRKRDRRLSTEPEDLESISQEQQLTSPKTGRLNRKTVQEEELNLDDEEESPLVRKSKKAKVTNLQQALDLDDLFHEESPAVVDEYAEIPMEDDMEEDKENSPVNIPTSNQMVKKVGSVVLDEEDAGIVKVASKKKKLMIVNDDE